MKVVWEKKALADLRNQLIYCRKHFGKRVAEKCKNEMLNRANILTLFPYAGVFEPLLAGEPEGFRTLVIHPNVKLIYCVDEVKNAVHVYRLWDTRRNPVKLVKHFR